MISRDSERLDAMRSFKFLAAAGLIAALPLSAAHADWYVSGKGGISFMGDADGASVGPTFDTQFDAGPNIESLGGVDAGDSLSAWGLMGNVVIDVPTGTKIEPYVGLGVGTAYVDTTADRGNTQLYSGTDWVFAYQVFAGANYAFTDNWSMNAEYRLFNTTEYDATTPSGGKFDAGIQTHNVLVGLTYHFGEPAKPMPAPTPVAQPAPAPAPAPASNYLVFFDWNQATITPAAREVLVKAAAAAKTGEKTQIALTGHTDRSGGDAYNMKLSEARAEAVEAELARLGIPTSIISVSARGESDPLVQTQDGIREPQNRRVEILIP
jgi:outer membrane protein OmpA-like peptidoglycan-associated protein